MVAIGDVAYGLTFNDSCRDVDYTLMASRPSGKRIKDLGDFAEVVIAVRRGFGDIQLTAATPATSVVAANADGPPPVFTMVHYMKHVNKVAASTGAARLGIDRLSRLYRLLLHAVRTFPVLRSVVFLLVLAPSTLGVAIVATMSLLIDSSSAVVLIVVQGLVVEI